MTPIQHLEYVINPRVPITKHYVKCPYCSATVAEVDHLDGQQIETAWFCENCGGCYCLKTGLQYYTAKTNDRVEKTLVLLRAGNIGLVVEGLRFVRNGKHDELGANDEYHYNESTCPMNYVRRIKAIVNLANQDSDPHGIFKYVKTIAHPLLTEEPDANWLLSSGLFDNLPPESK